MGKLHLMPDGSYQKLDRNHRFYAAWTSMRSRCNNPVRSDSIYYSGKGIIVEPEWNSFEQFKRDMLPTWFKGAVLDRKDGSKNYCAANCRWITRADSNRNRTFIKRRV